MTAPAPASSANDRIEICRACDLAIELAAPQKGEVLVCPRCRGLVARHHVHAFELSLHFALAALVPFAIILTYPFLTLTVGGFRETRTIVDTSSALFEQQFPLLGVLVFLLVLAIPLARLLAYIYVLFPLSRERPPPPYSWLVFRLAEDAAPWAMLDVFLVGVLVAVVKLLDLASVSAGVAVVALVALMLLAAASSATLDREAVWQRIRRDGSDARNGDDETSARDERVAP
jgi:paraquat-inducible protein A